MRLQENSLYTTAQERADLLKDKKKVMDALCFSLLGFLGCFKLGDSRAALKTYDQTEGQLHLNAIGDTNHDVSLSLKLADEAGIIPTSAAQNVTKLLYKIKTKQIKGKDLDDQQVRDLVKTLKIQSHPGDTMVNAVVSEFESGSLNLGQLAAKLYNLSKLPKFKQVSGEFRTLVSKGQFSELFAKAGTVTPPAAKISNNTSAKVTPAPAPVATPGKLDADSPFWMYPQDEQVGLFNDLLHMNGSLNSGLPKALVNADLNEKQYPSVFDGFAEYVRKLVIVEKKHIITREIISQIADLIWGCRKWFSPDARQKLIRALICGAWLGTEELRAEGNFLDAYAWIRPICTGLDVKAPSNGSQSLPIFTEEYFSSVTTDSMFLKVTGNVLVSYENLVNFAWMVSGGTFYRNDVEEVRKVTQSWNLIHDLAQWYLSIALPIHDRSSTAAGLFKKLEFNQSIQFLNKVFDIKAPKTASVNSKPTGGKWIVPVDIEKIQNLNQKKVAKFLKDKNDPYGIWFYDLDNWEVELKKEIKDILSKPISGEVWRTIVAAVYKSLGAPVGYMNTEPFLNWFCDQLEGSKAATIFKNSPSVTYATVAELYLNVGINFLDTKGVSPSIWLSLYTFTMAWGGINDDHYQKDLEAIYEENSTVLEGSLAGVFSTNTQLGYTTGSTVAAFLLRMHKINKFKAPNDKDFWSRIAQFAAHDLGEWQIPNDQQINVWELYQNVDQKAIRTALLTKYQFTRDWYFDQMYKLMVKEKDPAAGIEYFMKYGWTNVLNRDQIPKNIIDFVVDNLDKINPHNHDFFSNIGSGYGQWAKELIQDALKKALHTDDLVTVQSLINAMRINPESLNEYLDKTQTAAIIKAMGVSTTEEIQELSKFWSELESDINEIKPDNFNKLVVGLGMKVQTALANSVAPCVNALCDMLNAMMSNGKEVEVDTIFDSMSYAVKLKTEIITWFSKAGLISNALKAIKGDEVAPLIEVDQSRLGTLMKYNNITIPDAGKIDYNKKGFKLSDFLKVHGGWKMEPLAVTKDIEDQASCDRRTAEFDVFNKYRHGSIGIKFLKSFNVDIPLQKKLNEEWDKEHPRDEVMDPVFHGTGSVAASFILRYGFAVVSSTDSSVVGRMLGDGIYFSNVLDKCGQYVSDGGYSRGKGNKGYLFQMRANLGKRGVDYQAGGGNLVSPEWCVFHPNEQLKIYKAHFIELVDKSEIQVIKKKVAKLNENTAIRIYEMTEHLNGDIMSKGCVSYTFIDGRIPISETDAIDFEHWDPSMFGPKVTMEYSGLGPVIYIEVDDPSVAEMYAVRYTSTFMNQGDDFAKYLQLLRGGATS